MDLKTFRKYNKISQQELADYLGVGQSFISQIERGASSIPHSMIEKIRSNPEWKIIEDAEDPAGRKIPLYYDAPTIGGMNDIVAIVGDASRSVKMVNPGDWFPDATSAIQHFGDSMVEYPSGSLLVLRRVNDPRLLINGEIYVIETDEFRITKHIQDDGGDYIMAYSSNTDTYPDGHLIHSPIRIPKDSIRHLDLVLGCIIKRFSSGLVPLSTDRSK